MESLLIAFIFIMLIAGIATRKTTSSEPDRTYRPETVEKEENYMVIPLQVIYLQLVKKDFIKS